MRQVNLMVNCLKKSRGDSAPPPETPEYIQTSLSGFPLLQSVHCKRPAFHPNGHNRGDPPCLCGSRPNSIFQPRPHSHCTAAGDAYSLLTEVWHEPGMVPKVSLVFVHVALVMLYNIINLSNVIYLNTLSALQVSARQ